MGSALRDIAVTLAVIVIAIQLLGTTLLSGMLDTPDDKLDELMPPLNGPLYRSGERETADAQYVHDRCLSAANAMYGSNREVPLPRSRLTAYVICYIDALRTEQKRICDPDARQRLARYTRAYFAFLERRREDANTPVLAPFLEMQRKMDRRTDIEAGPEDFTPDARIVEGLHDLARAGAWPSGSALKASLQPEVPRGVIDSLIELEPKGAACL